jgi:hypothetical protein
MAEVPDVYADQFQLHIGPLGCTLNFQVSGANLVAPGTPPPIERVATIRLSLQHLKAMAFILHKQIAGYEAQGVLAPIAPFLTLLVPLVPLVPPISRAIG